MASPSENNTVDLLARLLNLNQTDSDAYRDAYESYFGSRENDSSSEDNDSEYGK